MHFYWYPYGQNLWGFFRSPYVNGARAAGLNLGRLCVWIVR